MEASIKELSNLASGKPQGKVYVKFMGIKIPIDLTYLKVKVVEELAGFSGEINFPIDGDKMYINQAENFKILVKYIAVGLANDRKFLKWVIRRSLRQMNQDQLNYLFDLVESLKNEEKFFFAYQLIKSGKYLIISKSAEKPSLGELPNTKV